MFFENWSAIGTSLSGDLAYRFFGGELVSTGILGGCLRVGVVWGLVNKPGKTLIGESNYAMAA